MHTEFQLENLKGKDHLRGLNITRRILLKRNLELSLRLWTGFIWLWIGTSGKHKHCSELSGSLERQRCFDLLIDSFKDCTLWSLIMKLHVIFMFCAFLFSRNVITVQFEDKEFHLMPVITGCVCATYRATRQFTVQQFMVQGTFLLLIEVSTPNTKQYGLLRERQILFYFIFSTAVLITNYFYPEDT